MRAAPRLLGLVTGLATVAAPLAAGGWTRTLKSSGGASSGAEALVVLPGGDVVAAGEITSRGNGGIGAVGLEGSSGAVLWQVGPPDPWDPTSVAVGGFTDAVLGDAGEVLLSGSAYVGSSGADPVAAVIDPANGGLLLDGLEDTHRNDHLDAIARDAAGDFVAAGGRYTPHTGDAVPFYVVKRSGSAPYAKLWETFVSPRPVAGSLQAGRAWAVAVDPSGDVIAAGTLREVDESPHHLAVVKLDGASGAVEWIHEDAANSTGYAVGVDAAGDVFVAGDYDTDPDAPINPWSGEVFTLPEDWAVWKLAGSDGSLLWRRLVDGGGGGPSDRATALVVDPSGDVFVGGMLEVVFHDPWAGDGVVELTVMRLAGDDGAERWRQRIPNSVVYGGPDPGPTHGVAGAARDVAASENGDVLVAGEINGGIRPLGGVRSGHFAYARLEGATGAVVWSHEAGPGEARAIAAVTGEAGAVVVGGSTEREGSDGTDFTVVKQSDCLAGEKLQLADRGPDPTRRRLVVQSRDRRIAAPAPGSAGDPTQVGAQLVVADASSGVTRTYPLPAAGWQTKRNGYRYRDREGVLGPCRKAQLVGGRRLALRCEGIGVDLQSRAILGEVALRLDLGTGASRYCLRFGGEVRRAEAGRFEARHAPPPSRCVGE